MFPSKEARSAGLILLLLLTALLGGAAGYQEGDFIPTARRVQMATSRTSWHDLLGRHCPRFGTNDIVAVPLPNPVGPLGIVDYKIELSFEHEAHITEWVPVLTKAAQKAGTQTVPLMDVLVTRSETGIKRVKAKAQPLPDAYLAQHDDLVKEFQDPDLWPKHLLVRYRWELETDVNGESGLFVMMSLCGLVAVALAINAVLTHGEKIQEFIECLETDGAAVDATPPPAPFAGSQELHGAVPMQPRLVDPPRGRKAD